MTSPVRVAYVGDASDLTATSAKAVRAVESVGKTSSSVGSKLKGAVGTAAKATAVAGTAAAVGLGAIAKNSVKLEASFSKTMSTLQASTGSTGKEIKDLTGLAMKLGAQTQFSANEAADAMLELSKAGISTKDIMQGAADGTLLLASAGGTDLATAATIASNAMATFNLKGKDMASIAAALAGGANASSASVESLGFALSQVGPGATNAGLSLQQTVGVLSAFDAAGIKGSDSGTSLKTMLARLTPQTDKAQVAMKRLGLNFTNADGSFKSITEVAQQLHDKLGPLSEAQRTVALNTIFGSDASRAATVLMKQGAAGIGKYIKATQDQTAAEKMSKAAMSGTSGAIEQLSGSFETMELALGQALAPLVVTFAHLLSNVVIPAIISGMPKIQGAIGKVNKVLLSLGEAFKRGGLDEVVSTLKGAGDTGSSASSLAASLGSVGTALGKIDFSKLVNALGEGTADTINVFAVAIGFAADHIDTFARILPLLIAAFAAYKTAQAAANVAAIANLPIQGAQIVSNLALASANRSLATQMAITNGVEKVGLVTKIRATAATIASTVAQKAAAAGAKAWAAVQWLLNAALLANPIILIVAGIIALVAIIAVIIQKTIGWGKIWDWLKNVAAKTWDAIQSGISSLVGWFKALPGRISKAIGALNKLLVEKGKAVLRGLLVGAKWLWDHSLVGFIFNRREAIVRAIGNVGRLLYQKGKDLLGGLKNGAVWVFDHTVRPYLNLGRKIKDAVGNLGSLLYGAGKDILLGLRDGLVYAWEHYVAPYLKKVTDLIPDWKGPRKRDANLLRESGRLIMRSLVPGFTEGARTVERYLMKFTDGISSMVDVQAEPIVVGAASGSQTVTIRLTAEQISQLQRGREIQADLDAWHSAGGRKRS